LIEKLLRDAARRNRCGRVSHSAGAARHSSSILWLINPEKNPSALYRSLKEASMKRSKVLLLALTIFLLGAHQGQQRPPAQEYVKLLESERRVEQLQIDRVIETLKLSPGQRIADLGAGSGLFTRPVAQKVGDQGIVYALDIDPDLLKHIAQTAEEQKLANIRTILAAEDDPKLPEPVDLIMVIDTLHHISNRGTYLKNLRRYLRPGGRLAIIDFSETWPAGHEQMKYSLEELEAWMKAAGYTRIAKHDFLSNNFFVVYQ
jgi:cyclopropane fatty-acyl-phospholipid synthase-like methyltransferase